VLVIGNRINLTLFGLAFGLFACSTLPSAPSTQTQLDDAIAVEMAKACMVSELAISSPPKIIRVSTAYDIITRTEQAIWYESERAIAILSNGRKDDVQDVLLALNNVHNAIASDWPCYRQSVGNANFHLFNVGPLGHLRDVALVAYAEAVLTHESKDLAGRARQTWVDFNLLISLPPDGKIFHRLVPGIIDEDSVQSVFEEPGYTEVSRFLDGLDDIHTFGINEQFPDVVFMEYDNLIGDRIYAKGAIINDMLCGEDGQVFLKAKYGLECRIETHEGARWYEVFSPIPIENSRDSYELYDAHPSLPDAQAAYVRERDKWLAEFEASPKRCIGDGLLPLLVFDPSESCPEDM